MLTNDAISEGGFASLPDALRTVPGLYVAQTDDHIWQISARGFSDLYNDKMLVLVDGRSVYTPLYGGVYWDALDIPLENIERVEVIRGLRRDAVGSEGGERRDQYCDQELRPGAGQHGFRVD